MESVCSWKGRTAHREPGRGWRHWGRVLNPDRGRDREGPTEEARGPIAGLEGEIGWIWASGLVMECMAGPVMLPEIGRRADLEEETFRFGPGDLGGGSGGAQRH